MEQPCAAFRRQLIGNPSRGVAFAIPHHLHEIGGGKHGVKVVVGNDPAVDGSPLCSRPWSHDCTGRSHRAAVVKTGSQATIVDVTKCAACGS